MPFETGAVSTRAQGPRGVWLWTAEFLKAASQSAFPGARGVSAALEGRGVEEPPRGGRAGRVGRRACLTRHGKGSGGGEEDEGRHRGQPEGELPARASFAFAARQRLELLGEGSGALNPLRGLLGHGAQEELGCGRADRGVRPADVRRRVMTFREVVPLTGCWPERT